MNKRVVMLFWMLTVFFSKGQQLSFGYTFGVAFSFGTETNRLGLHSAAYATYGNAQLNVVTKGYYNFHSLGKKQKGLELQLGIGGQIGFGRKDSIYNNFIGLSENNTFHDYAVGFSYVQYRDQMGTSQATGILNLNALNVNVITENDLFGNLFNQRDMYRTGALLVEWQRNNTKIGVNALLWTYDYSHCAVMVDVDAVIKTRFGYYKDEFVGNRASSLGILSVKVSQWLPYKQQVDLNVGINSEKVRNAMQNKFIHDQPFFPPRWVKRKPAHIPMLTIDNEQYLYDYQEIKPAQFYFNLGLNTLSFY